MPRARALVSWPLQLVQIAVLGASVLGTAALVPRIDGPVPLHWGPEGIDRWGPAVELTFYPAVVLVLLATEWGLAALIAGAPVPGAGGPEVGALAVTWKRGAVRLLEATFAVLLVTIGAFGLWTAIAATRGEAPPIQVLTVGLFASLAPVVLLLPGVARAQRALEGRVGEPVGRQLGDGQGGLLLLVLVGPPLGLVLFMALIVT